MITNSHASRRLSPLESCDLRCCFSLPPARHQTASQGRTKGAPRMRAKRLYGQFGAGKMRENSLLCIRISRIGTQWRLSILSNKNKYLDTNQRHANQGGTIKIQAIQLIDPAAVPPVLSCSHPNSLSTPNSAHPIS